MKITVYTIADCQFSKAEKEYLASHSLQYEEKNLETNKDFLTEMLAISNNFAGTPVTRVEKDDGSIAVLKGFTKEEFDTTFGFKEETTVPPKVEDIKTPAETSTPTSEPIPSAAPTPTPTEPPKEEPKSDELNAVIDKLEEKTENPPPAETTNQPSVTNPQAPTNLPPIPDFPAETKTTV
jgi:glutaredoxin